MTQTNMSSPGSEDSIPSATEDTAVLLDGLTAQGKMVRARCCDLLGILSFPAVEAHRL